VGTNDFMDVMHVLVAFVRVAEEGSFSAAARQLGVTPSAISRQVSRLEKFMGVRLLHRTTRHLRLTEAGLEALERGREMIESAQAALQVAEGHMRVPKGLVRMSAPKAFARHVLQEHLLTFLKCFPEVDLQLIVTDRQVDPIRENVDLMVRLTDNPPQGLAARRLLPVRQLVVASPSYLNSHPTILVPQDLTRHSCLSLGEQERDSHWRFLRDNEVIEVLVRGRYTINHSEMRLEAVEAGLGIGCVPDFVASSSIKTGKVVHLLSEWTFESNYHGAAYLVFAASRHTTPKIRVLIDHLVGALKDSA
jgi:DNA-binding transcriptional LysR family regulator